MIVPQVTSTIEFQMSLLLFVALSGYLIASSINQSAVVGIILAGIIVGPSWLGLITYTDFVSSLAHLGAVVLLFTVGLHFKLRDITNTRNFVIAFFGIIIPWVAGYELARAFDFSFAGSVFIGTALTATSIAITANVLKEMGKLKTETAKVIIGAAIIDDVLGLIVLSITEGIVSGAFSSFILFVMLLKAIAFLVFGTIFGSVIANRIMGRMDEIRLVNKFPEFIFIFAMMMAFFYGMIAEIIGLSAIIGSFLAGVSLEGVELKHSKSFKEGAEYLQIIFASLFFVSLGVLVDLREVTLDLMLFLIILTLVAILTKVAGCGIPAKLQGMKLKDSLIIGFGMAPRGEVSMIVALIGLNQQLILQKTYIALVLMSLLTTIIVPLIMRNWLYRESSAVSGTNP